MESDSPPFPDIPPFVLEPCIYPKTLSGLIGFFFFFLWAPQVKFFFFFFCRPLFPFPAEDNWGILCAGNRIGLSFLSISSASFLCFRFFLPIAPPPLQCAPFLFFLAPIARPFISRVGLFPLAPPPHNPFLRQRRLQTPSLCWLVFALSPLFPFRVTSTSERVLLFVRSKDSPWYIAIFFFFLFLPSPSQEESGASPLFFSHSDAFFSFSSIT